MIILSLKKKLDQALLKTIPGLGPSYVANVWEMDIKERISEILEDYSNFFKKHKARFSQMLMLKQAIVSSPNADPHHERSVRLTVDKADRVNRYVRQLLVQWMIATFF